MNGIGKNDINGIEIKEGDDLKVIFSKYDNNGRFKVQISDNDFLIGKVKYCNIQCAYLVFFDENDFGIISCGFGWHHEEFEIVNIKTDINDTDNRQ